MRPLASPLAWTLFIAFPVAGLGWLDGLPIGWLEAGAIAVAKLVVGAVIVPGGFTARYYANDTWSPPVERSLEFRRADITRRDERLAFGGEGQAGLPLYPQPSPLQFLPADRAASRPARLLHRLGGLDCGRCHLAAAHVLPDHIEGRSWRIPGRRPSRHSNGRSDRAHGSSCTLARLACRDGSRRGTKRIGSPRRGGRDRGPCPPPV